MRKTVVVLLVAAALTALALSSASAHFSLTLATNMLTGAPGDVLTLYGTIQNMDPTTQYLGGGGGRFPGTFVWLDGSPYYGTYSFRSYAPGEVWSGPLVDVTILKHPDPAYLELHPYLLCDLGIEWNDPTPQNPYRTLEDQKPFLVDVVPEPSSLMALACGVTGIGGMLCRRRRSR